MSLTAADAKKFTVAKLKDELTKRGLPGDGKKEQLVERLLDAIQKAEEDAILNESTGGGISIGNEDLLLGDDLSSIDANTATSSPAKQAPPTATTTSPAKTAQPQTSPPKPITMEDTKPAGDDNSDDKTTKPVESVEAKLARAQRFGLPVTSDVAKAKRTERFGSSLPAAAAVTVTTTGSDDAKKKRAERFGLSSPTGNGHSLSTLDEGTKSKLIQRAARFGLPITADGKTPASGGLSDPKLTERAKRFGLPTAEDVDTKKRARLERFGST
ncbi:hypothetical protein WR25_16961 isoform A [Diploscapter pachys]|uniref:SAP domain-containing protein n=1 Tax=Diploscapter pachys TaxID=2018661 RepID=A0A2A2KQZ2_9BILA|nr:hypothetical protein WR25_16961 isoform A [Diploscapter pachys]